MNSGGLKQSAGQFLRFSIIGVIGFVIDSTALLVAVDFLGLNLYSGRVFSFFVAATATWALNRKFTFTHEDRRPLIVQWARFIAANAIGGLVNYGVYAGLVTFVPFVATYYVIGVAVGAVFGLAFNFTVSKFWVFRS
jgi:putative flippase GtrA